MQSYTDAEFCDPAIPHVILTGDLDWDPTVLDVDTFGDPTFYDAISDDVDRTQLFDVFGNYKYRHVATADTWYDSCTPDQSLRFDMEEMTYTCSEHSLYVSLADHGTFDDVLLVNTYAMSDPDTSEHDDTSSDDDWFRQFRRSIPDYGKLRPLFSWLPTKTIKKTFENTTQYARLPAGTHLKKHYKSAYPALNVQRRDEPVATDTVYSDTPAIDGGETCAQLFVGTETLVTDVYGMKTEHQFVNTLEDNVRERGAMSRLLSDRAQVEISNRVIGFLRALGIGNWQSEPYQQHQNPAERRYQTLKR
eukprot:scaffold963_cov114-Cylindrotheca_fusiformis.AAC.2